MNLDDLIKPENSTRRLEVAAAALGKPPSNTLVPPKNAPAAKPLKRGFFDAPRIKKKPEKEDQIPVIRAKAPNPQTGQDIPGESSATLCES